MKKYEVSEVIESNSNEPKRPLLERAIYGVIGPGGLQDSLKVATKTIILPGLKNLIAETLHGAINNFLYRDGGERYRSSYGGVTRAGYLDYSDRYISRDRQDTSYSRVSYAPSGGRSVRQFAIKSESDAMAIVSDLRDRICDYGQATISDYYDMIGQQTDFSQDRYGWTSLNGVNIRKVSNGWVIDFPQVKRL